MKTTNSRAETAPMDDAATVNLSVEETITATEANRSFSRLLSEVETGKRFVITNHGETIAQLIPVDHDQIARQDAWDRLMEHLRTRPIIDIGPWTRDELYDDE